MTPKVSIIIPNYNHAKFLQQRLDTVFNQTYQDFEVILLDDASTDGSQAILKNYAQHPKVAHYIINKDNSGSPFKQWQKGLELAKGDYVWIAESDDYCELNFLDMLLEPMLKNESLALSYCQSNRINSKGEKTGNWITQTSIFKNNTFKQDFVMEGNVFIEKYLIHKNVVPNVSAVILNKTLIQKQMPLVFKPFMKYNADWYYYVLLVCNAKVAFTAESLNHFRFHEKSVIAKALIDSGKLKTYKMELQMRKFMLKSLKTQKPSNFSRIKQQSAFGNQKLKHEIFKLFFYNNALIKRFLNIRKKCLSLFEKS